MAALIPKLLLFLVFQTGDVWNACFVALYIAGLWKIFSKCGEKPWRALIPFYRDYRLARCADREIEGRILFVTELISVICSIGMLFYPETSIARTVFSSAAIISILIGFIYDMRVMLGVSELFGRKKLWAIVWVLFDWFPALLWGFGKKFQPHWQLKDLESDTEQFFSGSHASVLENGLTVNLEERTVTRLFKKFYLLRDIHIAIQPGHMVLLLGGSGAGKTTLLSAINGYEKARAEITLNGTNVYKHYKSMQFEIGYVPQADLMRGSDTVAHTLDDNARLRLPTNFTPAERRARVEDVMAIFGLTPVKNSQVEKLSGGQRKRLSIAMEFLSNPSLFILDEPDSGLDGVMARELMQQLRSIADQGKIIIVITHTPDRVIDLFDDVIVLAKDSRRTGRLAFFGGIEKARAFFGRESMEEIVRCINRKEEGGEGRADEFVMKYAEVQNG